MPKFQGGDAIDSAHCIALTHEIWRCEEAFKDFEALATQSFMVGGNRALACKMYNSYARFVHHLYEFMAACFVRDQHDTAAGSGKDATPLHRRLYPSPRAADSYRQTRGDP